MSSEDLPTRQRTTSTSATNAAGPALIAVTIAWALWMGRSLWFFSDEWNIMGTYPSGNLLEPFNGHLSLVPVALYQSLFHSVGVDTYLPYRLLGLAAFALLGATTWRYARANGGALVGLFAVAAVLWNSGGVTNVLFPFLLNFSIPLAALAAIWTHLDRDDPRHDIAASAWLAVALATSGLGLMVAVAVGVELLWNRAPIRRFVVMAPGPVLWALWYLGYGASESGTGGPRDIVVYAAKMLVAGGASLVGGNKALGVVVCFALGGLVAVCIARRRVDGRLVGALASPVAFVLVTAWSRIGILPEIPPDELRYRWTVGAFLVLAALCAVRALRRGDTTDDAIGLPRSVGVGLVSVGCIALIANAAVLQRDAIEWADRVETAAPGLRANLWVAEQAEAAGVVDADWWMPLSFVRFTAGDYLGAVERLGSPLAPFEAREIGGPAEQTGPANIAYIDMFGVATVPASEGATGECLAVEAINGTAFVVPFGSTVYIETDRPTPLSLDLFDVAEHAALIEELPANGLRSLEFAPVSADSAIDAAILRVENAEGMSVCVTK